AAVGGVAARAAGPVARRLARPQRLAPPAGALRLAAGALRASRSDGRDARANECWLHANVARRAADDLRRRRRSAQHRRAPGIATAGGCAGVASRADGADFAGAWPRVFL